MSGGPDPTKMREANGGEKREGSSLVHECTVWRVMMTLKKVEGTGNQMLFLDTGFEMMTYSRAI